MPKRRKQTDQPGPRETTADLRGRIPALDAYLKRVGAETLNFRRYMVKEHRRGEGYYVERTVIRILPDGTVSCSRAEHEPTAAEARAIADGFSGIEVPRSVLATERAALLQAERIERELGGSTFLFPSRREQGVVMVRQRFTAPDGQKVHVPWTLWSDGEWRKMEPDGDLPFWKPPVDRRIGRKMIHEGEKAAAFVDGLVNDPARRTELAAHPWGRELSRYEHWGMIGGALAPHRSDYGELTAEKPTEVVYVCDKDFPGESALQVISQCYGESLRGIRFGDEFPRSWDMADPIPDHLFRGTGKSRRYVGRPLRNFMQPATWATEMVMQPGGGRGRPSAAIRRPFSEEWVHAVRPEVYIHRDWAGDMWTLQEFNNKIRPFSHVDDTARLVKTVDAGKAAILRYDPGRPSGVYEEGGRFINTHVPSWIEPEDGDPGPFLDYMDYLVERDDDRIELMRWVATLLVRPEVKMTYGVLLISEMQGVGKSTLGEKILAPLIGEANVSYPSETEIVDSNYNYWLAHKRLAVVHEIYAGHSSKAYHRLQSIITDRNVTVSKKYMANYEVQNFIHVFACSNSLRALRLGTEDRRWFLPKITEKKRGSKFWTNLNTWLEHEGGLGKVLHWARGFIEEHGAVVAGTEAPGSRVKQEVVEDSYSDGQRLVANTLGRVMSILEGGEPEDRAEIERWKASGMVINGAKAPAVVLLDVDLVRLISDVIHGGRSSDRLEKPLTIRKLARSLGWHVGTQGVSTGMRTWGAAAAGGRVISNDPALAATSPTDLGGRRGEGGGTRIRPLDLGFARQM